MALIGLIAGAKVLRRRSRYLTRDPRRVAAACTRELADFLADQRIGVELGSTIRELAAALDRRFAVNASSFADAVEVARFGRPGAASAAAAAARHELARVKGRLRRRLGVRDRIRGLLSLRSLGFS